MIATVAQASVGLVLASVRAQPYPAAEVSFPITLTINFFDLLLLKIDFHFVGCLRRVRESLTPLQSSTPFDQLTHPPLLPTEAHKTWAAATAAA